MFSIIVYLLSHYYDSTAQTVMQQHVVEHGEHDKAQKKSWSSTASGLSSRCPDTVLRLDPARSGLENEVNSARLSLAIIQVTAHAIFISNTQSQQAHIRFLGSNRYRHKAESLQICGAANTTRVLIALRWHSVIYSYLECCFFSFVCHYWQWPIPIRCVKCYCLCGLRWLMRPILVLV